MNISEFLRKREEEVKWFHLNGFANGDPHSNGEFNTIVFLSEFYDLFVDIGANIGEFSKKVLTDNPEKAIIAFEPNPYLYDDLANFLGKNSSVYGVALSDVKGEMFLHIHPEDLGTSSLFSRTGMMPSFTGVMKKVKVSVDILDNYKKEFSEKSKIGVFVKIDTEGAELSIIKKGGGSIHPRYSDYYNV